MKNFFFSVLMLLCVAASFAQVGVGTTTPNSTLDVRGSIATAYRTFTASTAALITDNILVFTGTAATTLTLPTAVGIAGRSYQVKNASLTGPTPVLTVATTSSQTIDGLTSWTVNSLYQTVTLISNGTNWSVVSFLPSSSAISWSQTGNSNINPAINFLGTNDDKQMILKSNALSFLEFGRRQTLGLTQAGFTDYTDDNEKVTYVRSALQFEAPNASFYKPKMYTDINGNFRVKGSSAGTDYFEFGSTGTNNDGGFEFIIGDDGDEPILFKSFNYQTQLLSEIMRLQSGRMAVGSNAFNATNPEKLLIDAGATTSYNLMTGKGSIDNYLQINVQNRSATANASSDLVATADNGTETANYIDMGVNSSIYNNNAIPVLNGVNNTYLYSAGNDFTMGNLGNNKSLVFFTTPGATQANASERMRITGTGNVGIGNNSPNSTLSVNGSLAMTYRSGTGAYTLLTTDYVIINTGAAATWTLPLANTCAGRIYRLLNQGTGTVTLSQTVRLDAGTTSTALPVTAGSNFCEILSDGTEWRRIN